MRVNLAVFSAGFATFALLYCVQPLLPEFTRDFHISAATSSLALSLATGLLAFAILVASAVSEAIGRKPIMFAALLSSALLTIAVALLPGWTGLLIARALTGIALSGLPAVAMAYVGEEMHARSVGLAMGLYIGGSGLGGMAGRLLTGVAADFFGWRTAVFMIGALGVVCALIFQRALPPSRHFTPRPLQFSPLFSALGQHLRDPVLPLLFALGFFVLGAFVTVYNYIAFRLFAPPFSLSQASVGLIFSVYLVGILSSAWLGDLAGRIGRVRVLRAGLVCMLAGVLLTLIGWLPVIVGGIALVTFGFFAAHSVASSWVSVQAKQARAQASSLYLFSYYLGSSVVGSLGGVFWARGGWPGVVALVCADVLIAMLIASRLKSGRPA